MSRLITWEWGFLLASMMWGMVLAAFYDVIRIFRRIVIHRGIKLIFAEDIVFWMCSGFAVFHVTFMINDGVVRSFSIVGFVIGALIYRAATKNWLVQGVCAIVKFLLKPLKIAVKYFKMSIKDAPKKGSYEKVRDEAGKTGKA